MFISIQDDDVAGHSLSCFAIPERLIFVQSGDCGELTAASEHIEQRATLLQQGKANTHAHTHRQLLIVRSNLQCKP